MFSRSIKEEEKSVVTLGTIRGIVTATETASTSADSLFLSRDFVGIGVVASEEGTRNKRVVSTTIAFLEVEGLSKLVK